MEDNTRNNNQKKKEQTENTNISLDIPVTKKKKNLPVEEEALQYILTCIKDRFQHLHINII